mmetsp:Transcript_10384/g.18229  ORF Transcript_10384/g.18229 Transcript_10384/m.18229 type:complete len:244 (-) Transcript_10384:254-985(-)
MAGVTETTLDGRSSTVAVTIYTIRMQNPSILLFNNHLPIPKNNIHIHSKLPLLVALLLFLLLFIILLPLLQILLVILLLLLALIILLLVIGFIFVPALALALVLLLLHHHRRTAIANTIVLLVISPMTLDVHIPLLLTLGGDLKKFFLGDVARIEGNSLIGFQTTMRMGVRILVDFSKHEPTAFLEGLVVEFRGHIQIRGGLRRGNLPGLGDDHLGRALLVLGLEILGEEGRREGGTQIAQRQ